MTAPADLIHTRIADAQVERDAAKQRVTELTAERDQALQHISFMNGIIAGLQELLTVLPEDDPHIEQPLGEP